MNTEAEPGKRTHRRGFSLLEMMMTMLAIVVVAGIAIPSYRRIRRQTRIEEAKAQVELLAAGVRQLAWDTGKWPGGAKRNAGDNEEMWDLARADTGLLSNDGSYRNWKGPYVPTVKKDPWGADYFFDPDYLLDGKMRVVVGSFGPNGQGRNIYDSDNIIQVMLQ